MRPGDVPNNIALRDILYDKVKGSKLMAFDLHYYEGKEDHHPEKTYDYLLKMISKHIRLQREEKNREAKDQGLRHLASKYNKALPATNDNDGPKAPKAPPTPKAKSTPSPAPKTDDAAPVLADPKIKPHDKGGKGKGKGKGKGNSRNRTRSPSTPRTAEEKKKIPCRFHFGTGTTCTKGRDCEYSHSKNSPRADSPAGARKSVCYAYLQGKCTKGKDCKYIHDKKALAVVKSTVKTASSKTPGSPGQTPRGGDPKAAPSVKAKAKASAVALAIHSDDESDNESFCSSMSTVSEVSKSCIRNHDKHGRVVKDKRLKFNNKRDVIRFHVKSNDYWSKSFSRKRMGKQLTERELRDTTRVEQIKYEELRSIVKGLALERSIEDPKKGNAKATINGTWKLDISVNKDPNSHHLFVEKFYHAENDDDMGNTDLANAQSTVQVKKKMKFIMDTGCGYDLISRRKARELDLPINEGNDRMVFMTANGITETREVAECSVDSFNAVAKPFVLEQSPAVFSVGIRCMKLGYTFVWPPNEQPFMINSSGKRIDLHSKDDILPGDGSTPHDDQLASDIYNLLNRKGVATDAPAVAGEEDGEGGDGVEEVVEEEDADGMIEVDVHEGEPRLAKPGALKAEAKTIAHLLTHRYKNPYCQSCVRAKMKHFKTHRGAFQRVLKKLGDLITFDFADLERSKYLGALDERELLVIRDRFTGIIQAFPMERKTAEAIVISIKRFIGNRKVILAFSDQAPQFVKACRELKIPLDTSVPGRKVTDSLAERNIQFLVGATATCLLEAGLPACYWTFAVSCVSHLLNVEDLEGGSAWFKMHKEHFKGPKIPLGAKVIFKPSDARDRAQKSKFDPKGMYGVFAGYVIESGNKWSRKMYVWDLHDFSKANLAFDCEKVPMSLQRPHVTEKVELVLPITFPLKAEYERLNGTLEGMNKIADRERRPDVDDMIDDVPPDDDDEEYEPDDLDEGDHGDDDDDDRGHHGPGGRASGSKPESSDLAEHHPIHHTYGEAGDGIKYHDDEGQWVKLDKLGRPYRVDRRDGRRIVKTTRPKDFSPEEWKNLGHEHRKALAEVYKTTGEEAAPELDLGDGPDAEDPEPEE